MGFFPCFLLGGSLIGRVGATRSAYFLFDNGGSFYMLMAKNAEVLVPFSGVHYIESTHIGVMLGHLPGAVSVCQTLAASFFC